MEMIQLPLREVEDRPPVIDYRSNVDTSRPFNSVKEAVAVFGERFLTGEIYSHKPTAFTFPKQESTWRNLHMINSSSPPRTPISKQTSSSIILSQSTGEINADPTLVSDTLKKLEAELEETKLELKLLKERECETEVALASLNAELHKNMSKIAQAEATSWAVANGRKDMIVRKESNNNPSPSLAQILSINGEKDASLFGDDHKRKKKKERMRKKKPIIPLVGDLFSRKKGSSSSTALHNPLFTSSQVFWN